MDVIIEKAIEITKYPLQLIGHQLGYLFYYQRNKDNLNDQIETLDLKIESFHHQVEAAREKGDETLEGFTEWLRKAEEKSGAAKAILNHEGHRKAKCSCRGGPFPNVVLRHKLSRKASKMAETIVGEIQKAAAFTPQVIFYSREKKCYFENEDFVDFETTKKALTDVMEALKDPNLRKVGVYGMGGVGKTTLLKKVAEQVKRDELFSKVVLVTVSKSKELKNIQQEVADVLGLGQLEGENMPLRAGKLQDRLKDEKKILLIFDDIWDAENLNLKEAGICFKDDQRGCKMLLASRDRNVLCRMDVERDIFVATLSDDEAMNLFKKLVGNVVDNLDLKRLGASIVGECGGLPIAVETIAGVLKKRDQISFWENALKNLERSARQGYGKAFTSIKMSYDILEREEQKILLLCSMHDEDANISVENLMNIYVAGCDFFQEVDTLIKDARNLVDISVNRLKDCCLLLDGDHLGTVKMHDVIRDVVMSIASDDNSMHCFTNIAKLEAALNTGKLKDSTAISLLGIDFKQLPERLSCSRLEFLLMLIGKDYHSLHMNDFHQAIQIPDRCFEEAKQLRAMCIDSISIESLPPSFCSLQYLQTLSLQGCTLEDEALVGIGELKNLKVLNLSKSNFKRLPKQIGQLTRLRLLNLNGCRELQVIQPNVILSLIELEELYMDGFFIEWEIKGENDKRRNASLTELMNLPRLRALHLNIPDASVIPKDFFGENLEKYKIIIGYANSNLEDVTNSRALELNLHESNLLDQRGFQTLMKKSEVIYLGALRGVSNIVTQIDVDGFPQLKTLLVEDNSEIQGIVDSIGQIRSSGAFESLGTLKLRKLPNLENICHENKIKAFGQLRKIVVENCDKLKNVISFSIATKLEDITVSSCSMMEEIVYHESKDGAHNAIDDQATNDDQIVFCLLRQLALQDLPSLLQFSSSTQSPMPSLFNEKVTFPSLEVLKLYKLNISGLWPTQLPTNSIMQKLTRLIIKDCCNLKYLFPSSNNGNFVELEHLEIRQCPAMEEVVVITDPVEEERRSIKILFPKLRSLKLEILEGLQGFCAGGCNLEFESLLELTINNCPKLQTFTCTNSLTTSSRVDEEPLFNEKIGFPCLERLFVEKCGSSKYILSYAVAISLSQLNLLKVSSCEMMEELVVIKEPLEVEGKLEKISFSKLKDVYLNSLPKLKRFSSADYYIESPSFVKLSIQDCPELSTSITHSRPKLVIREEAKVEEKGLLAAGFNEDEEVAFSNILRLLQLPKVVGLRNLQDLTIQQCNNLKCLWSFAMVESLAQLKKLRILDCEVLEEVVLVSNEPVGNEGRLKKISFLKLESLRIENLPKLRRFSKEHCIEYSSLLKVRVFKCPNLRTIFMANSTTSTRQTTVQQEVGEKELVVAQQSLFSKKVALLNVIKLCQIPDMDFRNLQELTIRECNNVRCLLTFAMVEGLAQLKNLTISDCNVLEVVGVLVTKELREEERLTKISFPKLEMIWLENLPKLKWFCEGNYIKFQSLSSLRVLKCPEFRTFMAKVTVERIELAVGKKDLVVGEQPLFDEKVGFSNLKELGMDIGSKVVNEMWPMQSSTVLLFPELTYLYLTCSLGHHFVFTPNIHKYRNLGIVILKGFHYLEKIWELGELLGGEEEHGKTLTSKLSLLQLYELPRLIHLFEGPEDVQLPLTFQTLNNLGVWRCGKLKRLMSSFASFKNLREVVVSQCHGMKNLLGSSTAKTLVRLTSLSITGCKQMTQVVANEKEGEAECEIVFGQLEILALCCMPSLKSFYCGNSIIQFPKLKKVIVSECPDLRSFSHASVSTPKLHTVIAKLEHTWPLLNHIGVYFNNLNGAKPIEELWEGDLCESVRKLWEDNSSYTNSLKRLFSETDDQNSQEDTASCSENSKEIN